MPGTTQWRLNEPIHPDSRKRMNMPEDDDDGMGASTDLDAPSPETTSSGGSIHPGGGPPVVRNKNAWKQYALSFQTAQEQTEYQCVWRCDDGPPGSRPETCGYNGKRHLVKRHIETRHLQFKYVSHVAVARLVEAHDIVGTISANTAGRRSLSVSR